jgi:tRNA(Ile)-lysidine synthase
MAEDFAYKLFREAGLRQGWWKSRGVVAALSGGGDSVAMLWLLRKYYRGRIVAAHLDHCTREGASHEDAHFCAELCAEWGIECRVKRVEVYEERLKGESFEMAGRRERYEHFFATAEIEGLSFVALGHSADDVVETQILNLARGTGLAGLRGMPERRGKVVRPIIDFRRAELRSILRDNGVPWREDLSNYEPLYMRNKIREELLPWIRENLNPEFDRGMVGLSRQAEMELDFKKRLADRNLKAVSAENYGALACWLAKPLKDLSDVELIDMIREQGARLGLPVLSRDRTMKLLVLLRKGGFWRFQWAGDVEVCYSDRGIGWLHRCDIREPGAERDKEKQAFPWWAS